MKCLREEGSGEATKTGPTCQATSASTAGPSPSESIPGGGCAALVEDPDMLSVRVGKKLLPKRQLFGCFLRILLVVSALVFVVFFAFEFVRLHVDVDFRFLRVQPLVDVVVAKSPEGKCGRPTPCPEDHFTFKIVSGAANVVGPNICLEDQILMTPVKKNTGEGINIAIVNGQTGALIKTDFFNMYNGDVKPLIELLKSIETGSIVLMASYDDPSTKLNAEARNLIAELGSNNILNVGFRDNWIFVGGKGIDSKSPFEKHKTNEGANNKYDGWPEMIEMDGCIPKNLN